MCNSCTSGWRPTRGASEPDRPQPVLHEYELRPLELSCLVCAVPRGTGMSHQTSSAEGGNRTHTPRREPDFESGASANSATSALSRMVRGGGLARMLVMPISATSALRRVVRAGGRLVGCATLYISPPVVTLRTTDPGRILLR